MNKANGASMIGFGKDSDSREGEHTMSQQPTMSQCPSYRQPWKSFVAKFWMVLPTAFALAFLLLVGQGGHVQAATLQNMHHSSLSCNVRTYSINQTISLERSSGDVNTMQAVNLNHAPAVDIWHGNVYEGTYSLPTHDGNFGYGPELEIYSYGGSDWVDACTNWTRIA